MGSYDDAALNKLLGDIIDNNGGYFSKPVKCPSGGTYTYSASWAANGSLQCTITCSKHEGIEGSKTVAQKVDKSSSVYMEEVLKLLGRKDLTKAVSYTHLYFLWQDKKLDVEMEALSEQINDPELQHQAELATINQLSLQEELDLITDLEEALAVLDSQPSLEESVFETIKRTKPKNSRWVSMACENGVLTVTASSKERLDPYQYAKDLTRCV